MNRIVSALAALTLALPLAACGEAGGGPASWLSKPAPSFGDKVRAYLLEHPEVLQEAVAKLEEKEQAERVKTRESELAAGKQLLPKYRDALERDPRDFVANPNGSITVVEFFDYNCGYCKLAAPEVVKLIRENPDVRFVFKEFPFQTEASMTAARVALTAAGKSKGLQLHQAWMAAKPFDDAAVDRAIRAAGLDPAAVRASAEAPEITKQLADVRALTKALKIGGTPTFIVGGHIIGGADIESLRAAISQAQAENLKRPGVASAG